MLTGGKKNLLLLSEAWLLFCSSRATFISSSNANYNIKWKSNWS